MLQSTLRRRQKLEKLRKKREKKRIKRKSILKFRMDEHGDKSSLEIAIKTTPKKKKKGKNIKIDKPKRLNKVRQNAVRAHLPDITKMVEVKPGFFRKLVDKIFNK